MLYGDREATRRIFTNIWEKALAGSALDAMETLIASVIKLHPEYHDAVVQGSAVDGPDFTQEGRTNPFLHMGLHIALLEQVQADRPHGVAHQYYRVMTASGSDAHAAEHRMIECLASTLWTAQRNNMPPDEQTYLECLRRL